MWVHMCVMCGCVAPDTVKISDFGLSTVFRHMGKERKLSRRCGTPPYIAPEVHVHVHVYMYMYVKYKYMYMCMPT